LALAALPGLACRALPEPWCGALIVSAAHSTLTSPVVRNVRRVATLATRGQGHASAPSGPQLLATVNAAGPCVPQRDRGLDPRSRSPAVEHPIRVLVVTTEFPRPDNPGSGIFVARQVEALRAAGIDVEVLSFLSRANPLNHLRAWRELRRRLASQRHDLIHAHFGHAALIAVAQRRLPVVATYHGEELQGIFGTAGRCTLKGRALIGLSQLLSRRVDEVIVVSERLGRLLSRKDHHVIPGGVDLERFRPLARETARQRLGWPTESRIVLFSALDPHKPIKRLWLARAAMETAARQVDAELRIASGVPPETMPLYLNASDALLLTSVREGSPTVIKEALACNLPIVSTDVGDVSELTLDVRPGAVCAPTPEALGAALVEVLRQPLRSNGRSRAEELDAQRLAARVLEVYEQALATRAGRRVRRLPGAPASC